MAGSGRRASKLHKQSSGLLVLYRPSLADILFLVSRKLQEWGREGLTFVNKGGIKPNRAFMRPGQEANYTAQWQEMHAYLDNASAAGV